MKLFIIKNIQKPRKMHHNIQASPKTDDRNGPKILIALVARHVVVESGCYQWAPLMGTTHPTWFQWCPFWVIKWRYSVIGIDCINGQ